MSEERAEYTASPMWVKFTDGRMTEPVMAVHYPVFRGPRITMHTNYDVPVIAQAEARDYEQVMM